MSTVAFHWRFFYKWFFYKFSFLAQHHTQSVITAFLVLLFISKANNYMPPHLFEAAFQSLLVLSHFLCH